MKNKLTILLIGILLLGSCNKEILDKKPLDSINDATVWSDPVLIDSYLSQIYGEITVFDMETSTRYLIPLEDGTISDNGDDVRNNLMRINYLSDDSRIGWERWVPDNGADFKMGYIRVEGGCLEFWPYNTIRKANEFIERVPTSPLQDSQKKLRIAEARFLRAFMYFSMVKRYGGVPLITKVQLVTDPLDELYPKRNSEEEIYNFVLSELDICLPDLLPTSKTEKGRPSIAAGLALKSRAALYAGSIAKYGKIQLDGLLGFSPDKANKYFQISLDASQALISSNEHALYVNKLPDRAMNYRSLFTDKWNKEIIFARDHNNISPLEHGVGTAIDFCLAPAPNAWGYGHGLCPYLEMIEEYEHIDGSSGKLDRNAIQTGLWTIEDLWKNKDPRFFGSIYTHGTPWKGAKLDFHKGLLLENGSISLKSVNGVPAYGVQIRPDNGDLGSFGVMKYLNPEYDNMDWRPRSDVALIVFRYGEILLNHAEAAFELGQTQVALDAVNQIRKRAGIALLSDINMEKIRHERKVELAFEGHRYWDVRRWRTAVNDLTRDFSDLSYIQDLKTGKLKLQVIDQVDGNNVTPAFYEKNYYLPISLKRTGNNPNLIENPGY